MIIIKTNHKTIEYLNDVLATYIHSGQDMFNQNTDDYNMESSIALHIIDTQLKKKLNAFPPVKKPTLKLYYFQASVVEKVINSTTQYFKQNGHLSNTMRTLSNNLNQMLA